MRDECARQHRGSYYWFSYPSAPRSMRRPDQRSLLDFHRMRDGCMILSLSQPLYQAGFDYAGELLNFPADLRPETQNRRSDPPLGGTDILVVPTRPPLDDNREDRRSMRWSNTDLETQVFTAMRKVFFKLDRGRAVLSQEIVDLLDSEQKVFTEVHFQINGGASVVQCGRARKPLLPDRTTVAYLVSIPHAVDAGARLLGGFGMGGYQTLLWSHLLRDQAELLKGFIASKTNRLLMGSFVSPEKDLPYPYLAYSTDELHYQKIADIAF